MSRRSTTTYTSRKRNSLRARAEQQELIHPAINLPCIATMYPSERISKTNAVLHMIAEHAEERDHHAAGHGQLHQLPRLQRHPRGPPPAGLRRRRPSAAALRRRTGAVPCRSSPASEHAKSSVRSVFTRDKHATGSCACQAPRCYAILLRLLATGWVRVRGTMT